MANRPLPNVDPDALSKLASQYPGSGQARTEPKLGGSGSGGSGSGGSGSGGPGSGGPGSGDDGGSDDKGAGAKGSGDKGATDKTAADKSPADKGAADKGAADKGGSKTVAGAKPASAVERPVASSEAANAPSGSTGGRGTGAWAFVFALIAVGGAVGALAAPSLRDEARAALNRYVPQMNPEWVDFLTGQDTKRLEITYEGLDQRIAQLTGALERITGKPGIDAATARELLLKTDQNQRLGAAEQAASAQAAALQAVSGRIDGLEQRLAALDEVRQTLDGLTARADAAEQSMAGLRDAIDALGPRLSAMTDDSKQTAVAVDQLSKRVDAAVAEMGERIAGLSDEVAKANAGLAPVADVANQVAAHRKAIELPLIGMTQLRLALDRDTPYKAELTLAERLVGNDAEAMAAMTDLAANAGSGVTTMGGLRRDFAFVATQMGGSLTRIQSWTQRLSSWLEVLVGTRSLPEADPIGEVTAAVASIDAALEAGQLDLAINEAVALNGRRSDVLLEGWIVEARKRLATERAFNTLSERIYARIGTTG